MRLIIFVAGDAIMLLITYFNGVYNVGFFEFQSKSKESQQMKGLEAANIQY